jgi:hypothetical protein
MDEGSSFRCRTCGWRFRGLIDGECVNCHEGGGAAGRQQENAVLAEHVRDDPDATVASTSFRTGIAPGRILAAIREGRLRMKDVDERGGEVGRGPDAAR